MKKYNACDLKVVRIDTEDDIRYLICKYNRITDTYTEVLTNSKIKGRNNSWNDVPLSKYYPPWFLSYHKGRPSLMLSSREILEKYIEINPKDLALDVDDLKVIEDGNGYNIHYVICKYDEPTGAYIDVLTDARFMAVDESCVKPLSKYYGSSGKIQKWSLLKLYINMNYKSDIVEKKKQRDEASLERATLNLFAGDGSFDYYNCQSRPQETNLENLPCHLRDDEWLAKALSRDHEVASIDYGVVLNFVKKSELFKMKRHEYELKIVKSEIKKWGKFSGNNVWTRLSSNCDLRVREEIVKILSRIGLSEEAIEEGIEKYADLWREKFMSMAFLCEHKQNPFSHNKTNFKQEDEYQENWLKIRRYEYYQRHKKSVDLYGEASSDMLMSTEDAKKLKQQIESDYKSGVAQKIKELDNAALEQSTLNLFVGDGHYDYLDCKSRSQRTLLQYLPCNLRNDEWLAKILLEHDHTLVARDQMLAFIDYDTALNFVKKSQLFQEKRHEYELKIVKWQINNMEKNLRAWYPADFDQWCVCKPSCDLKFRELLVESLTGIGMDKEVIEEGIEKYADSWREELMNRAFLCEYELPLPYPYTKNEPDPDEDEYQEKWLKLRRYEYYQRHKKSIDLYGKASSDMLMNEEEAQELKKYLDKRNEERKRRIEELKAPKIIPYQKKKSLLKNIKHSA